MGDAESRAQLIGQSPSFVLASTDCRKDYEELTASRNFPAFFLLSVLLLTSTCKPPGPTPTSDPTSTPAPTLTPTPVTSKELAVSSPDGKIEIVFILEDGAPYYQVSYSGLQVIKPSKLGFKFKEANSLDQNLAIVDNTKQGVDEIWT